MTVRFLLLTFTFKIQILLVVRAFSALNSYSVLDLRLLLNVFLIFGVTSYAQRAHCTHIFMMRQKFATKIIKTATAFHFALSTSIFLVWLFRFVGRSVGLFVCFCLLSKKSGYVHVISRSGRIYCEFVDYSFLLVPFSLFSIFC